MKVAFIRVKCINEIPKYYDYNDERNERMKLDVQNDNVI